MNADIDAALDELAARLKRPRRPNTLPRFEKPLPLVQVQSFEARHSIELPADFKGFITRIGNGSKALDWRPFDPTDPVLNHPKHWSSPFVHPRRALQQAPEPPGEDVDDLDVARHRYFSAIRAQSEVGIIPITDEGCGIFTFLVVTGQERGHMWWSNDRGQKLPIAADDHQPERDHPQGWRLWYEALLSEQNTHRHTFLQYCAQWFDGPA